MGTGGGFPGLPMAIACPSASFTLLDSCAKKMKIVSDIVRALELKNVEVVTSRAEEYRTEAFNFIMGRAVSSVPNFLTYSSHFLGNTNNVDVKNNYYNDQSAQMQDEIIGGLLYLKGGDFRNELIEAKVDLYSLHRVCELIPNLQSDKYVLYIPPTEVSAFQQRLLTSRKIADQKHELRTTRRMMNRSAT